MHWRLRDWRRSVALALHSPVACTVAAAFAAASVTAPVTASLAPPGAALLPSRTRESVRSSS